MGLGLKLISSLILIFCCIFFTLSPGLVQAITLPRSIGLAMILGNAAANAIGAGQEHTGAASSLLIGFEMIAGSLGITYRRMGV